MFGKKPPKIEKTRIERALGSSQPIPVEAAQTFGQSNKRRAPRKKIWAPCQLTWPPNGLVRAICIDVSETGARLRFSHKVVLVDRFRLSCPSLNLDHDCQIIRQDGFDASVRFVP
jgi:hypothetical protein